MKRYNFVKLIFLLGMIVCMITSRMLMDQKLVSPFVSLKDTKLPLGKFFVLDSVGIILGLRRVVSDIAWIQLLQYYGSEPKEIGEEDNDDTHNHFLEHMTKIQPGKYKLLLNYCQRVVRLDHLFSYVYFYGSSALAWNVERPDEGLQLIEEGKRYLEYQKNDPNTDYWDLIRYQQAIYYKLGGKYKEMLDELKDIVDRGKAPYMVKAILANLYKKFGEYEKSLEIWYELLYCDDPNYVSRAKKQITEITAILKKNVKN